MPPLRVVLEPVVVESFFFWPGAYWDALLLGLLSSFFNWPGAYSDAPGAPDFRSLLLFICWPGAYCDAPGEVVELELEPSAKTAVGTTAASIKTMVASFMSILHFPLRKTQTCSTCSKKLAL